MKNKGFIGPIGDDLPSLIPIVFALTIFFASFNSALSNFDSKNSSFSNDLETLKVARILRSNGYIVNLENFRQLCSLVQVNSIKYMAGIAEFNALPEDSLNPEKNYDFVFEASNGEELKPLDELFYKDPKFSAGNLEGVFYCTNLKNLEEFNKGVFDYKKTILRVYPVILEKDRGNGLGIIAFPMQLVVVSWVQ